jgi:hypothetical protein
VILQYVLDINPIFHRKLHRRNVVAYDNSMFQIPANNHQLAVP